MHQYPPPCIQEHQQKHLLGAAATNDGFRYKSVHPNPDGLRFVNSFFANSALTATEGSRLCGGEHLGVPRSTNHSSSWCVFPAEHNNNTAANGFISSLLPPFPSQLNRTIDRRGEMSVGGLSCLKLNNVEDAKSTHLDDDTNWILPVRTFSVQPEDSLREKERSIRSSKKYIQRKSEATPTSSKSVVAADAACSSSRMNNDHREEQQQKTVTRPFLAPAAARKQSPDAPKGVNCFKQITFLSTAILQQHKSPNVPSAVAQPKQQHPQQKPYGSPLFSAFANSTFSGNRESVAALYGSPSQHVLPAPPCMQTAELRCSTSHQNYQSQMATPDSSNNTLIWNEGSPQQSNPSIKAGVVHSTELAFPSVGFDSGLNYLLAPSPHNEDTYLSQDQVPLVAVPSTQPPPSCSSPHHYFREQNSHQQSRRGVVTGDPEASSPLQNQSSAPTTQGCMSLASRYAIFNSAPPKILNDQGLASSPYLERHQHHFGESSEPVCLIRSNYDRIRTAASNSNFHSQDFDNSVQTLDFGTHQMTPVLHQPNNYFVTSSNVQYFRAPAPPPTGPLTSCYVEHIPRSLPSRRTTLLSTATTHTSAINSRSRHVLSQQNGLKTTTIAGTYPSVLHNSATMASNDVLRWETRSSSFEPIRHSDIAVTTSRAAKGSSRRRDCSSLPPSPRGLDDARTVPGAASLVLVTTPVSIAVPAASYPVNPPKPKKQSANNRGKPKLTRSVLTAIVNIQPRPQRNGGPTETLARTSRTVAISNQELRQSKARIIRSLDAVSKCHTSPPSTTTLETVPSIVPTIVPTTQATTQSVGCRPGRSKHKCQQPKNSSPANRPIAVSSEVVRGLWQISCHGSLAPDQNGTGREEIAVVKSRKEPQHLQDRNLLCRETRRRRVMLSTESAVVASAHRFPIEKVAAAAPSESLSTSSSSMVRWKTSLPSTHLPPLIEDKKIEETLPQHHVTQSVRRSNAAISDSTSVLMSAIKQPIDRFRVRGTPNVKRRNGGSSAKRQDNAVQAPAPLVCVFEPSATSPMGTVAAVKSLLSAAVVVNQTTHNDRQPTLFLDDSVAGSAAKHSLLSPPSDSACSTHSSSISNEPESGRNINYEISVKTQIVNVPRAQVEDGPDHGATAVSSLRSSISTSKLSPSLDLSSGPSAKDSSDIFPNQRWKIDVGVPTWERYGLGLSVENGATPFSEAPPETSRDRRYPDVFWDVSTPKDPQQHAENSNRSSCPIAQLDDEDADNDQTQISSAQMTEDVEENDVEDGVSMMLKEETDLTNCSSEKLSVEEETDGAQSDENFKINEERLQDDFSVTPSFIAATPPKFSSNVVPILSLDRAPTYGEGDSSVHISGQEVDDANIIVPSFSASNIGDQIAAAHVIQLDVDDTLVPTSQFCDQNWLDKQLKDLPDLYQEKLIVLDVQLTRLFRLLHRMVVHEDIFAAATPEEAEIGAAPTATPSPAAEISVGHLAPASTMLDVGIENIKSEDKNIIQIGNSDSMAAADDCGGALTPRSTKCFGIVNIVDTPRARAETSVLCTKDSTNSMSCRTIHGNSPPSQTSTLPSTPLAKPSTPRGVYRLSQYPPDTIMSNISSIVERVVDGPITEVSKNDPRVAVVRNNINNSNINNEDDDVGRNESEESFLSSTKPRCYLLSVVIVTNATMSHIRAMFPRFLPKLTQFFAEKDILLDDLVCSARDLWGDEFPFEQFYDFWKCWTLEDVLAQLRQDGIKRVTVLSIGDDEPERRAAAYVKQEMADIVHSLKLVKMITHPDILQLSIQLEYIISNLRNFIKRPTPFDIELQINEQLTLEVMDKGFSCLEPAPPMLQSALDFVRARNDGLLTDIEGLEKAKQFISEVTQQSPLEPPIPFEAALIQFELKFEHFYNLFSCFFARRAQTQSIRTTDSPDESIGEEETAETSLDVVATLLLDNRDQRETSAPYPEYTDNDSNGEEQRYASPIVLQCSTQTLALPLVDSVMKNDLAPSLIPEPTPVSRAAVPSNISPANRVSLFATVNIEAETTKAATSIDNRSQVPSELTYPLPLKQFLFPRLLSISLSHSEELKSLRKDCVSFLQDIHLDISNLVKEDIIDEIESLHTEVTLPALSTELLDSPETLLNLVHNVIRFLLIYPAMFLEFTKQSHQVVTATVASVVVAVLNSADLDDDNNNNNDVIADITAGHVESEGFFDADTSAKYKEEFIRADVNEISSSVLIDMDITDMNSTPTSREFAEEESGTPPRLVYEGTLEGVVRRELNSTTSKKSSTGDN